MNVLRLRTADDCEAAAAAHISHERVSIALDLGLDADEERRLERRLTRMRNACGCSESAIALCVGFILAFYLAWAAGSGSVSLAAAVGRGALALFSAGFVAGCIKLLARSIYRRAYRNRLRGLANRLRTVEA